MSTRTKDTLSSGNETKELHELRAEFQVFQEAVANGLQELAHDLNIQFDEVRQELRLSRRVVRRSTTELEQLRSSLSP